MNGLFDEGIFKEKESEFTIENIVIRGGRNATEKDGWVQGDEYVADSKRKFTINTSLVNAEIFMYDLCKNLEKENIHDKMFLCVGIHSGIRYHTLIDILEKKGEIPWYRLFISIREQHKLGIIPSARLLGNAFLLCNGMWHFTNSIIAASKKGEERDDWIEALNPFSQAYPFDKPTKHNKERMLVNPWLVKATKMLTEPDATDTESDKHLEDDKTKDKKL